MEAREEEQFTANVVAAAYRLQTADMMGDALGALPGQATGPDATEVAKATQQAEHLVQQHSFREWMCPALRTTSDDVGMIAKIATPILLKASLGPQAPITLSVLGFAAVAFVIARAGISAVCPPPA